MFNNKKINVNLYVDAKSVKLSLWLRFQHGSKIREIENLDMPAVKSDRTLVLELPGYAIECFLGHVQVLGDILPPGGNADNARVLFLGKAANIIGQPLPGRLDAYFLDVMAKLDDMSGQVFDPQESELAVAADHLQKGILLDQIEGAVRQGLGIAMICLGKKAGFGEHGSFASELESGLLPLLG
jgi:hypothetical protein